jgi:hypothetical protein
MSIPPDPQREAGRASRPAPARRRLAMAALLALLAGAVYLPTLEAGFVNWDDPRYVTGNPHVRRLSWQTVVWAFSTFEPSTWHPLTWLSLALDYRLHGPEARGFHLTNLLLHAANTALVFLVWESLSGAFWQSATAAALFGLHPLRVESVAWVAGRKDVLSGFFWMLALAAYVRYARVGTPRAYLGVALALALALLGKATVVTLPLVLLLLDYWPLRRLSWRAVAEKLPLAAGVAAVAVWTLLAGAPARAAGGAMPVGARVANAFAAYVEYLKLSLWPVRLSPWYSHPALEGPPLTPAVVAGSGLILALVTVVALARARSHQYGPVGWLWYLGTLVPVVGLVQVGRQGMADRYTYLPHVGLGMLVAWTVAELPLWRSRPGRVAGGGLVAAALVALAVATVRQTAVWHDSRTLWRYTARVNPHAFVAHQALGILLEADGRHAEAITAYRRAAKLRADVPEVHASLGLLLLSSGNVGAAAAQFRKSVALRPESADDHYRLARALLAQGRPSAARRHLGRALAIRPDHAAARRSLAALGPPAAPGP